MKRYKVISYKRNGDAKRIQYTNSLSMAEYFREQSIRYSRNKSPAYFPSISEWDGEKYIRLPEY